MVQSMFPHARVQRIDLDTTARKGAHARLFEAVRRGDVESTSQRNRAVFLASSAIADDPAFGDPALFGYRLRGTTVSASAALSYALHERAAVNVGYLQERTRAAEGLEYVSRVVDASIAWRF